MAVNYSPSIVLNGMMLYVDAANQKSYPGTGVTWADLSGNGYDGTMYNGVSFLSENSGVMSFDGSNDHVLFPNPSNRWAWTPSDIGNNSLTFELWVKSSDATGFYLSRPWNGSGQYNLQLGHTTLYLGVGTQYISRSFTSLATGLWEHIVVILTPTQTAIYRNGVINAALSNHGLTEAVPSFGNSNLSLTLMTLYPYGASMGDLPGHAILGNVGLLRAYSRDLSASEVKQNFNATRGRYGV